MPGGDKEGGGLEYTPFKMKGSPMKRNFGIGEKESPLNAGPGDNKKGLWESLTGKKFRETKFATETKLGGDIVAAGDQIKADITRAAEYLGTGQATTPRKPASESKALVESNVGKSTGGTSKKKNRKSKGTIVTDHDATWDYKKQGNVYLTKKKKATDWITPDKKTQKAIQEKVFPK